MAEKTEKPERRKTVDKEAPGTGGGASNNARNKARNNARNNARKSENGTQRTVGKGASKDATATAGRQLFRPVPAPTRVDYPLLEEEVQRWWDECGILHKYLHRNDASDKRWSFVDGPITANNPMGVHHAWGRTYKDLWQRFNTMRGYKQRYQNGFDSQGLWVEVEVEK